MAEQTHVLFVEDDDVIREATQLALERDGFAVTAMPDGLSGLEAFRADRPDIALLDVMVPGLDAVSLCRRIRDESTVPVIMLSARADSIDVVLGLEAGADDYVTKPFDGAVLVARIRTRLRPASQPANDSLRIGDLTVDVAALELDRSALPSTLLLRAFTAAHLVASLEQIEVGTPVLIVGFPLGFHDTLHHLPVARQAVIASAFGMRFQGQGYFLTDARMHRGASGAPVVARMITEQSGRETLPWTLLGVHAARMDVTRDIEQDERLDLNCAWYTDIILKLTDHPATG